MTSSYPLRPELLLEHRSFLRALAASLLADEHEADDVVQEAFARALERPPDEQGALKPWLARVVRNASLNRLRGAARRGSREELAARGEAVPSSAEIAERLAVQRRVVEAMAALAEPLRTPVYLRFYESLPPRAIAQRLGRPVETVRSQIRRGLERLRADLDREYGDRRAWSVALVPLLRPRWSGLARGARELASATRPGWALLVGGAAALSLLFLAVRGSPGALVQVPEQVAALARRAAPAAPAPTTTPGASSERAALRAGALGTAGAERTRARLVGRVLRASGPRAGEPLDALDVVIADGERVEQVVTDAAGRFASAAAFDADAVLAPHDGVERAPVAIVRRERLADGTLELCVDAGPCFRFDLALPPGAPDPSQLGARLHDPEAPAQARDELAARLRAGALPWTRFARAPRMSLMGTGGRATWALELVSDDGLWGDVARVHAGVEPDRPLAMTLAPRGRVVGRVLDAAGAPVAGAEVVLEAACAPSRRARSDEHGRFELGGLLAGDWTATIGSSRHARERRALALVAGETSALDVVLAPHPTGTLEVTLASATGRHEPDGALSLVALDLTGSRRDVPVDRTRAPGPHELRLDDVPEGEYELKPPMRDGFAWDPPSRRVRVTAGSATSASFVCRDDVASRPLAFRVSDAAGRPLERFRVVVLADRYRLGLREAAAFEPDLAPREARHGEPCARVVADMPLAWVIEAEGHRSHQGRRGDLRLENGMLVADVRLEPPWRLHLWVGVEEDGRERGLSGARLATVGGKELGRTLGDGELVVELLYDPGRLVLELEGWRVERWEGFASGMRRFELDRHRAWLVRD